MYYVTAVPGYIRETIGVIDADSWAETRDVALGLRYEILAVAKTRGEAEELLSEFLR